LKGSVLNGSREKINKNDLNEIMEVWKKGNAGILHRLIENENSGKIEWKAYFDLGIWTGR
jgi:hypothetical protein